MTAATIADPGTASGLNVRENVPLAPFTTFGIGGPARWFVTVTDESQIVAALAFARHRNLPHFVLGGGSNLLISDAGFPGLVLHMALRGVSADVEENGFVHITAAAGESWDALVQFTVKRNLQGIECLAGIPGTVGGTPIQNVGAYGQEISQTFVSARCYDTIQGTFLDLRHAAMGFAYRTSVLNTSERGRYIVVSVTFALVSHGSPDLTYADLKRVFSGRPAPTLTQVAGAVRTIRHAKGMVIDANDPDSRSAGSFFRNPIISAGQLAGVALAVGLSPDHVPHWSAGEGRIKLPAAWLLECAGFTRGTIFGRAGISTKHTLALINRDGASEREIAALRDRIVTGVRQRFGILLEQEPVGVS